MMSAVAYFLPDRIRTSRFRTKGSLKRRVATMLALGFVLVALGAPAAYVQAVDQCRGDRCSDCGSGKFNTCDETECGALGTCAFDDGWINGCIPDPTYCNAWTNTGGGEGGTGEAVGPDTGLDYELLAPLPSGFLASSTNFSLSDYISGVYRLGIAIAGVLAVLMITIAGLEYMLSETSFATVAAAKARIYGAVGGLLLALGSYVILYTINPALVEFNLNLDPITIPGPDAPAEPPPDDTPDDDSTPPGDADDDDDTPPGDETKQCDGTKCGTCGGGTVLFCTAAACASLGTCVFEDTGTIKTCKPDPAICKVPDDGDDDEQPPVTGDEASIRALLSKNGVGVNNPPCTSQLTRNCTNVAGLPSSVVNGVISLKKSCVAADSACKVVITGGTEPGHKTHAVGRPILDLRRDAALSSYIIRTSGGVKERTSLGPIYKIGSVEYVDEVGGVPHWHICNGIRCPIKGR
jgi:hypothetical protein